MLHPYNGKIVEFYLKENIFSDFFEKLKVSEYYLKVSDCKEKSEFFITHKLCQCKKNCNI